MKNIKLTDEERATIKRRTTGLHPKEEWAFIEGWIAKKKFNLENMKKKRTALHRKAKDQAMKDLGLTKVKGALGGIYWE